MKQAEASPLMIKTEKEGSDNEYKPVKDSAKGFGRKNDTCYSAFNKTWYPPELRQVFCCKLQKIENSN